MKAMFFSNGNTMFFNDKGQQVPELQQSYMKLYCDLLEKAGINPPEVDFTMPDGRHVSPYKTEFGWNWKTKEAN